MAYTLLYGVAMFFIKASILIFYHRIFFPDFRMRMLIYIALAYTFVTNAVITILFGALCLHLVKLMMGCSI